MKKIYLAAVISVIAFILSAYVLYEEEPIESMEALTIETPIEEMKDFCKKYRTGIFDNKYSIKNNGTHYIDHRYCYLLSESLHEDQKPKTFADLTCEEIRKLNIAGLKIPKNDTTFSQDRIFDCLKEKAQELDDADDNQIAKYCEKSNGVYYNDKCYDTYKNFDTTITDEELELDQLKQMNCDEMIQDVYDGRNGYKSKENRSYARDRTGDCNDKQERPIKYGYCSTILISAQTHQNLFTDDSKSYLIKRIHDCVEDNEFQLNEVLQEHQLDLCNLYKEEELAACKYVQITSQPFSPTIDIDELYPILIENERKIINNIDCSELKKTYDGKIQKIHWNVHRDMIVDALNDCKNK